MALRRKNNGNKTLPLKAKLLVLAFLLMTVFQISIYLAIVSGNGDKVEALYGFYTHVTEQFKNNLK